MSLDDIVNNEFEKQKFGERVRRGIQERLRGYEQNKGVRSSGYTVDDINKNQIRQHLHNIKTLCGDEIAYKAKQLESRYTEEKNYIEVLQKLDRMRPEDMDYAISVFSKFADFDKEGAIAKSMSVGTYKMVILKMLDKHYEAIKYHPDLIRVVANAGYEYNADRIVEFASDPKFLESIGRIVTRVEKGNLSRLLRLVEKVDCKGALAASVAAVLDRKDSFYDTLDVLEKYQVHKKLSVVANMITNTEVNDFKKFNRYLEFVSGILDSYGDVGDTLVKVYKAFSTVTELLEYTIEFAKPETFEIAKDDFDNVSGIYVKTGIRFTETIELAQKNNIPFELLAENQNNIYDVVRVADKYDLDLTQVIKNKVGDFHELLSERSYNKVMNSEKPLWTMVKIIHASYSETRRKITDPVGTQLDYKDLELVKDTLTFVQNVHKKRESLEDINKGFYQELNRSIDQGSDYKSKIRNLRRYCNEVQQRVRDEAEELMVVTNGA